MPVHSDISPLSQLMLRVDAVADGAPPADTISTGFPSLDKVLGGGVRLGDLIVLGGDVGSGKSALALAMALRAAQLGADVAFLSGEMDPDRVLERTLAIEGRASIDDIRQGSLNEEARAGLGAAAVRLRHTMPRIGRLPTEELHAIATGAGSAGSPAFVIVDSLQCLPGRRAPQDEEMACAIRLLKQAAVDGRVALLVTAHLPLLVRSRPNLRPVLDDFGVLGSVTQHADVVLGLYREELYESGQAMQGATELAVLKNRNGPTSYIDLYFYKQWLRFEDMVDPER
jgi:replicative DNA helicase